MIEVELPDGSIAEFPDGTDKAIIKSALQKRFAKSEPTTYDPTSAMSGGQRFVAGYGKVGSDLARGAKQILTDTVNYVNEDPGRAVSNPMMGPALGMMGLAGKALGVNEQTAQALTQEADEAKRLDKPLLDTRAGTFGNIGGNVAAAIPTAFIPGANTYTGAGLTGAFYGAMQPTGENDSRVTNTALGGMTGVASQALGRALGAGYQGVKSYLAPLTEKGQQNIVANTLRRFMSNPGAMDALEESAGPGVQRTLAEATLDPGIAGLQLATKNADPVAKSQILGHELRNQAARLSALNDIAGTPAAREAAVAARESAVKPLYAAADEARVQADPALKRLLARPSLENAWSRAVQLAEEKGEKLVMGQDIPAAVVPTGLLDASGKPITREVAEQSATYSGKGLHYLKMALDDLIDSPQTSGIGKNEVGAITSTKRELLNWMDNAIEPYGAARKTFAEMSRPINQMDVGRQLYEKLVPALTENSEIPTRITAQQYANALRNAEQTVKQATGMDMPLEKIMSPDQMATLKNIASDLGRKASADDLARTVGSTTAQNLAAENLLRQTLGPLGVPKGWMEGQAMPNLAKALMSPYKLMNTDAAINQKLAQALMNPQEAADLLKSLPPAEQSKLIEILSRAAVPAGIVSRPNAGQ
jgi:hypothetical protein